MIFRSVINLQLIKILIKNNNCNINKRNNNNNNKNVKKQTNNNNNKIYNNPLLLIKFKQSNKTKKNKIIKLYIISNNKVNKK
jgi:hypothetical protein